MRRIEAVTGEAFLNLVDEMNMRLVKAAELLKTTPMELINKAQSSMNEIRELHQTIERMKDKLFAGDVDSLMFSAKDVNGLKVVTASRENTDANDLRKLGDFLRDKNPNTVAALGAVNGEKVTLLAVCGKNAVARGIKAGDIIKNIAPIVGGKGGGKPRIAKIRRSCCRTKNWRTSQATLRPCSSKFCACSRRFWTQVSQTWTFLFECRRMSRLRPCRNLTSSR